MNSRIKLFRNYLFLLLLIAFTIACNKEDDTKLNISTENNSIYDENDPCDGGNCGVIGDKLFYNDGVRYLWGGSNPDWHFKVDQLLFETQGLKYGLGRELFSALIEPEFVAVDAVSDIFNDTDEFILIHANEGLKAYPIDLLVEHEVINDVIDDQPVMVGYCVIADFPCVYSRNYCDRTFTFAVSGYTYHEDRVWDDKDGFVLWDRDTESLWWPLSGEAVSGGMIGTRFDTGVSFDWERVNWEFLSSNYSEVQVLAYNQEMEVPENWPRVDTDLCN